MSESNLPALSPKDASSEIVKNQSGDNNSLTEFQFVDGLPEVMVSLLERRYLVDFDSRDWQLSPRQGDTGRPLLREVTALGRPTNSSNWFSAMPHVLNACNTPGHSLVMAVHGQGDLHRLYLGGRRIVGDGGGSTEDYLASQESIFKSYFTGLEMGDTKQLNAGELPEMVRLLRNSPTISVITGIPSGRGERSPVELQNIDWLVKAVGTHKYLLMVVAEPLSQLEVDYTLDACRHLQSEIHSYVRRGISRNRGESKSESLTQTQTQVSYLPAYLQATSLFLEAVVGRDPIGRTGWKIAMHMASSLFQATGLIAQVSQLDGKRSDAQQQSISTSSGESSNVELLDAYAEACEVSLQKHIDRLSTGRSNGWWRTAIYVAAENEATQQSVSGALRSIISGSNTVLEPLRTLTLPVLETREFVEKGQILSLYPAKEKRSHPLGSSFDVLGTCINSEELAVVVNLPQNELPGLPMRTRSEFALTTPIHEATEKTISLGTLKDGLGRDLSPVMISLSELNRHCFVTGMTGYGKTNTCMQILLDAYRKFRIPFLVIEPVKSDYDRLANFPELNGTLRVYSIGGNTGSAFRINPFTVVPGIPLARHISTLKAVINASFPMYGGMPYITGKAIENVYSQMGWSQYTSTNSALSENSTWYERAGLTPSLSDLQGEVEKIVREFYRQGEVHDNMRGALLNRLGSLTRGINGMALNCRYGLSLDDLFEHPTVIQLENLGDNEDKAFVMAVILMFLREHAEIHRNATSDVCTLRHITLIEEAHRLLERVSASNDAESSSAKKNAVRMFTDMLAEVRSYGEGFIIADQIPSNLAQEVLKNTNLKITHRLTSPDDRQIVGECMNLSDRQISDLDNFYPGLAAVHDERIGEAIKVQPNYVLEGLRTIPTTKQLYYIEQKPLYLRQHGGCLSCQDVCQSYHLVKEMGEIEIVKGDGKTEKRQENMAKEIDAFIKSLLFADTENSWKLWQKWCQDWGFDASIQKNQFDFAYCSTVNAAYAALGNLFFTSRGPNNPTPYERMLRERAISIIGKLIKTWLSKTNLDDEARDEFKECICVSKDKRHPCLWAILKDTPFSLPQHEPALCKKCPVRCRLLFIIAPKIRALPNSRIWGEIDQLKASDQEPKETRHFTIQTRAKQIFDAHLNNVREGFITDSDVPSRSAVYCLLANNPTEFQEEQINKSVTISEFFEWLRMS